MKHSNRGVLFLSLLTILGVMLAACGDTTVTTIPTTTTGATTTTVATSTVATAKTIEATTAASTTTIAVSGTTSTTVATTTAVPTTSAKAQPPVKVAVGFTAPDFTAKTVNGETIQLSQLKGRAVIINFWATY